MTDTFTTLEEYGTFKEKLKVKWDKFLCFVDVHYWSKTRMDIHGCSSNFMNYRRHCLKCGLSEYWVLERPKPRYD